MVQLAFALVLIGVGIYFGRKTKEGPGLLGPAPKTLQNEAAAIDDASIKESIAKAQQGSAENQARAENVLRETEEKVKAEGRTTRREGNTVIPSAVEEETDEDRAKRFREWAAKNMAQQGGK